MSTYTRTGIEAPGSYWGRLKQAEFFSPDDSGTAPTRLGYQPALEGVRTMLLLAVVIAHTRDFLAPKASGFVFSGFGSLTMFFVISGFLVTLLIVRNLERSGNLEYRRFMWRRVKRLGAPVLLFVVVYFVASVLDGQHLIGKSSGSELGIVGTCLSILTFTVNLLPTFGFAQRYDIVHFWSLGVDMQVYIILPLLLWLLFRFTNNVWLMAKILVGTLVVLQFMRFLEFHHFYDSRASFHTVKGVVDFARVYQGTETNLDAFIAGVLVAIFWSKGLLPVGLFRKLAIPSLIVFMACMVMIKIQSPSPYIGGYTIVILCSIVVISDSLRKKGALYQFFSHFLFRVLGRVSYTVYIWHLFVFMYVARWVPSGVNVFIRVLIAWLALGLVSVVAWWIAERPLMRLPPLRDRVPESA